MDAIRNPYSPGAGSPPPALAGRDVLREQVRVAIERIRIGRAAKSVLMVGLRGVGKTVLLEQMRTDAAATNICTLRVEAPENRSLPAMIAPQLRLTLLQLSLIDSARDKARRALRALAGFAKSLKLKYNDIEVGFDADPEPGLADNGDLEGDLSVLLEEVGRAAQSGGTAVVLFLDELQYVERNQLAALISALHRSSQARLPVTVVGAGLPQLRGLSGEAKSYAERLFDFPMIGPLNDSEAKLALQKPAQDEGVEFTNEALAEIIEQTKGYPYFLQEWGKHSWEVAGESPITLENVKTASVQAIAALDESFFRVRFDRLTPTEKRYLRAMAELGPEPLHRSGDIAASIGKAVSTLAPLRQNLILKGMIWSPSHGDTAFTVPLFDDFMKRIMPGKEWKSD
jgi:hypothetical protein